MKRLGPQAKKLFETESRTGAAKKDMRQKSKKYTFILPFELMKKVKHNAVEQDKTISQWLAEAIEKNLPG
ncbi:MAG: hypothetical protein JW957_00490 [Candidatus Omnitrophica bacterium]|nr:hypothetical protein [Candidatus Omnitrophota bacterium]